MRKTFKTIVDNVVGEAYDSSTSFRNKVKNYANRRYSDILRRINFNIYNYDYSFNTVSGTEDYVLNDDCDKILSCIDTTNSRSLTEYQNLTKYYDNNPDSLTLQSSPVGYCLFNSAVQHQPSSAVTLSVKSSSTSDTTQKIRIKGISSSVEVSELVTLNGTTAQTSSNQYTRITGLSKDNDTYGYITIYNGTTNYAVMPVTMITASYKIIRLFPIPAAVYTIKLPYLVIPSPLINDEDYPVIDIADIIEIGATADAHKYQRRVGTANHYESIYESMIANYVWDKENLPNMKYQFQGKPYSRETVGSSSRFDGYNK